MVADALPGSLPSLKKSLCESGASGMWQTDRAVEIQAVLAAGECDSAFRLLRAGSSEPTRPVGSCCLPSSPGNHRDSLGAGFGGLSPSLALPSTWADL